jgi:hypothetical protein
LVARCRSRYRRQHQDNDSSTTYREIAALLDNPNVPHPNFTQPRAHQEAAETAADDHNLGFLNDGLPVDPGDVWVVREMRERVVDTYILIVPVVA